MLHTLIRIAPLSLAFAAATLAGPPTSPASAVAPPASAPAAEKPAAYDETANAGADIGAALVKAKRNNTRVYIQWGANWCGWCKLLHKLAHDDAAIRKELQYEYEVVLVDVGRFDKNMDLATKYGADLKASGLPFLTILDSNGKVLAGQETGSLERKPDPNAAPGHDSAKVLAFLKEHEAESPEADDVLAKGLAAATTSKKAVFLHFGAPWCGWCHRLEDWLARPDVSAIMAKDFVDVRVDTDRMAGGQGLLVSHVAKTGKPSGGIPWFEFLTADGTAIATSTSPEGNIGFPSQPNEIAWFIGMVKKSAKTLTPQDYAALEASLQAPKTAAAVGH